MHLSSLSREQLESELLGEAEETSARPRCSDSEATGYAVGSARSKRLKRRLAIARELLLRDSSRDLVERCLVDAPHKAREYLQLHFATLEREVFVVLMLDVRHRVIEIDEMFTGTLTQTSVYPREVVRTALATNAAAVVFAHNHPSGDPDPSRADEYLTQSLKSALALVDVRVIDHFVFGAGKSVSFAERGLI